MNQPINISLELLISGGGDTDLTHPRVIFTIFVSSFCRSSTFNFEDNSCAALLPGTPMSLVLKRNTEVANCYYDKSAG